MGKIGTKFERVCKHNKHNGVICQYNKVFYKHNEVFCKHNEVFCKHNGMFGLCQARHY
jgi:hypothetical protein